MMKLCSKSLGLSVAIMTAICVFLTGLLALSGYYLDGFAMHEAWLFTLSLSTVGIILGTIEALFWGFICGFFIAFLYNKFLK